MFKLVYSIYKNVKPGNGGLSCKYRIKNKSITKFGGKGGDVVFVENSKLRDLSHLKNIKIYAQNGFNASKKKSGSGGKTLKIELPTNTIIKTNSKQYILKDVKKLVFLGGSGEGFTPQRQPEISNIRFELSYKKIQVLGNLESKRTELCYFLINKNNMIDISNKEYDEVYFYKNVLIINVSNSRYYKICHFNINLESPLVVLSPLDFSRDFYIKNKGIIYSENRNLLKFFKWTKKFDWKTTSYKNFILKYLET